LRFIDRLGAIELDQRNLKTQIRKGFHPLFENLGWIISASLKDGRSGFGRIFGTDPKFSWDGYNLHVPGTRKQSRGATWPGSEPRSGFRRATSDEINTILTNMWRYKIVRRSILVGAYGVANTVYIVEVSPNPQGKQKTPVVKPAVDAMFSKSNVTSALIGARKDVGSDHVSLLKPIPGLAPYAPGKEPPNLFSRYAAKHWQDPVSGPLLP
jgi:hypothetical protein